MKFNLKTILIIVVAIIILITIFSFTTLPVESKENIAKKNEINSVFAIWMNIAGPGDKMTLSQNEIVIKKDLFDKLNEQEIKSIKDYSMALGDMIKLKNTPWNANFLNALAYLTTNFKTAKEIVSKTNVNNLFSNFGSVPQTV